MVQKNKVMSFIKSQWLGAVLIIVFALYTLYGIQKTNELLLEKNQLEKEIKALEQMEELHWSKFDSLKSNNKIIIQKERTLIQLEHDTIKIIDTIAFSELQRYFAERYNQKDSIK